MTVSTDDILQADRSGPEQFVKAFVAELVLNDFRSLPPRDPDFHGGLERVVELLDARATALLENEAIEEARPWVEIANDLRFTATGGVENWERALRRAQLTFTQVGNPDYEFIDFLIDKARAKSELDSLAPEQQQFAREAANAFIAQVREDE